MLTIGELVSIFAVSVVLGILLGYTLNRLNYKACVRMLMKDEGFTRGMAIDYTDMHPELWKEYGFLSIKVKR